MKKYNLLTDEELVAAYKAGDNEAAEYLIEKNKNLVRKRARNYYLTGGDSEDLLQEGMIGLYKAVRDFNPEKEASFTTFATVCINRQINKAVNKYNRKKNLPLNAYVSLDSSVQDKKGKEVRLDEIISAGDELNPEKQIIDREKDETITELVNDNLSRYELEVLNFYRQGMSYAEIAECTGKTSKSIYNAVQRIRKKILDILE